MRMRKAPTPRCCRAEALFSATLHLKASLGALGQLYPWLEQAGQEAGVPPGVLSRMHVAAEEAATNAVRHGGMAEADASLALTLTREGGLVSLLIEDAGVAFDPLSATLPDRERSLAAVTPGGWGLNLIRKFCPEPSYRRAGGLNQLTLAYPVS